jgi:hypothetical protein
MISDLQVRQCILQQIYTIFCINLTYCNNCNDFDALNILFNTEDMKNLCIFFKKNEELWDQNLRIIKE